MYHVSVEAVLLNTHTHTHRTQRVGVELDGLVTFKQHYDKMAEGTMTTQGKNIAFSSTISETSAHPRRSTTMEESRMVQQQRGCREKGTSARG